MEKKWTEIPADENQIQELAKELKVNPLICKLLVQRGITSYEEAKVFFRPTLEHLHDPFLMKDMDKAVERVIQAIDNNQKILLYGDYDVDGTTCVALMYTFLARISPKENIIYYIPNRYKEGYGVSKKGIEYAKEIDAQLIIAMDCGIQAMDKIALANSYGIDSIICDHHLPSEILPEAVAVLDPKRKDCEYPFKELSGCGVAFKLAQGIAEKQGYSDEVWSDLFDLLVISIGCDIVRMTGENRTIAHFGLRQINEQRARVGLTSLIEKSGKELPVSIGDLVFGVGPMINAAGRLADAKEAVELMLSGDKHEADIIAMGLYEKNLERRDFEKAITKEAVEMFKKEKDYEKKKSIVLSSPNWHKGIVGIAASKLVEKFHRPTIILMENEKMVVGSARSVSGFNVHQAIHECSDLLNNFGGHQHAAGLSLRKENLEAFKIKFEEVVSLTIEDENLTPEIPISSNLNFDKINTKFLNLLKQFSPFGPGNRRPVFRSNSVRDSGYSKIVKDEHLKLSIKQKNSQNVNGIGFWMGEHYDRVSKEAFDICYVLEENHWKGKTSISLNLKDIK